MVQCADPAPRATYDQAVQVIRSRPDAGIQVQCFNHYWGRAGDDRDLAAAIVQEAGFWEEVEGIADREAQRSGKEQCFAPDDFRRMFHDFDVDHAGAVSRTELRLLFKEGLEGLLSDSQRDMFLSAVDAGGSADVSEAEYMQLVHDAARRAAGGAAVDPPRGAAALPAGSSAEAAAGPRGSPRSRRSSATLPAPLLTMGEDVGMPGITLQPSPSSLEYSLRLKQKAAEAMDSPSMQRRASTGSGQWAAPGAAGAGEDWAQREMWQRKRREAAERDQRLRGLDDDDLLACTTPVAGGDALVRSLRLTSPQQRQSLPLPGR
eukprot:TRINITY_DN61376_c0_g1_i1.p2 TRINITY_DN61376_c0_g1~~TRINITY_DN61376_c0_g1_i1.p2  ORF type:complete len:319 (+),score=110.15 TRINITY_DN61376_c0_g1_i1:101-1057(+)